MDNTFQNAYMATLFISFGAKNLASGREFVQDRNGKPIFPHEDKLFIFKLILTPQFVYLIYFYVILSREVYPRSTQPNNHGVKHPLFIWYVLVHWNPLENGTRPTKNCHLDNIISSLKPRFWKNYLFVISSVIVDLR
jgi:hypothetical protein